uniref:Uncharacterized protein n=1 Tax=Vespula pensylvanica TaxID=30213 RepID=A0A834NIU4_VESPE|nr:hypothetical protein H0235_013237 [Vespula pensylvanica]
MASSFTGCTEEADDEEGGNGKASCPSNSNRVDKPQPDLTRGEPNVYPATENTTQLLLQAVHAPASFPKASDVSSLVACDLGDEDEDRVIEETKTIALERNSNAFPKMRNTDSTVFSRPVRECPRWEPPFRSITIQITAEVFVELSINGSQLDRAFSPTTFRIILVRDASLEVSALQRAEDTVIIIYDMGTIAPHREVEKIFATVTLINSKKTDDQHRGIIRAKA